MSPQSYQHQLSRAPPQQLTHEKAVTPAGALPEAEEPSPTPGSSARGHATGRGAPGKRVLKASGAYFQEGRKAVGHRLHSKGANRISHSRGPRAQTVMGKQPGPDPLADVGRASRRGRRQLGLTPGTQALSAATCESPSHHEDAGGGKHRFRMLLPAYYAGPGPTHQPVCTGSDGLGLSSQLGRDAAPPISRPAAAGPPELPAVEGSQQGQDTAPPTRGLALAPTTPGHHSQRPPPPKCVHWWTGTSPGPSLF